MLDKTYRPQEVEARIYQAWENAGAFKAGAGARPGRPSFSIAMPPPNVTGSLHMGHALNHTLQDILTRFERMRGKDVLWQPGLDHAGIATQLVVERELAKAQETRQSLGREAFEARVWQWKAQSGGMITQQLRSLGVSCDWSRERFTMDAGLSKAVLEVFVRLYREKLIYRDKRLVNWDPRLETAVSDLEVEMIEVPGYLWHLRYPIEGEDNLFISVATTRPETMLGDTGIAVHPDDPRYRALIGRYVTLPLVGRRIPIVADAYADPETGSGAVKITPAHDFNDFEVGRRHGLDIIPILDKRAQLNEAVPPAYRGLDRFEARKRVIADLEAQGLVERIETITHSVPHDEKTKTVVLEPFLTEQWYCDAKTLAADAIRAVEEGAMSFVPKHWERTYFDWMRNIQPWCISRQLWWGHRIPAWYGPDGAIFVATSEAEAQAQAQAHYGREAALLRDSDVLDTWFSSALWPFSTLGWPDRTAELERYFPTSVLLTGYDIIFFWVARMMMMSLHFLGEVPFATTVITALVTDARGQKMSKTRGNVVDPMELISRYGADALRFTLAQATVQGRNIRMAPERVEPGRNFITKLWNAARFAELHECRFDAAFDASRLAEPVNRWILGAAEQVTAAVTRALEEFRFSDAASALYEFVWDDFCDWYLEFAKPLFSGAQKDETQATTAIVLNRILRLMHPIAPFVSEELWARTGNPGFLALSEWPAAEPSRIDPDSEIDTRWVIRLVSAIRSARAELNVPAAAQLPLILKNAAPESRSRLARHRELILRLARLSSADAAEDAPIAGALQIVHDEALAILPLAGFIDIDKERARLSRELARVNGEVAKLDQRLSNAGFLAKAPEEVVEELRERREEFAALTRRLSDALSRLG